MWRCASSDLCFKYNISGVHEFGKMNYPRSYPASAVYNNTLWITGGNKTEQTFIYLMPDKTIYNNIAITNLFFRFYLLAKKKLESVPVRQCLIPSWMAAISDASADVSTTYGKVGPP